MDTTSLRSICEGVLCGLKPSHLQLAREWSKRNSRELTPCRDSAGPPLSSGCGPWPHSLGNCWGLWKEKIQFKPFLLWAVPAYCLWQAVLRLRGRWVLVKHVGRQTCCLCGQEVQCHPEPLHWQQSQTHEQVRLVRNLFYSTCGALANTTFL